MLIIESYLSSDRFGGTGLFAGEHIKAGQVIWKYDPAFTQYFSLETYLAIPETERAAMHRHIYPVYAPDDMPPLLGVMLNHDNSRYMNHSETPNTGHVDYDPDINIALCDIHIGDELTFNYYEFDPQNKVASMNIPTCKDFLLLRKNKRSIKSPAKTLCLALAGMVMLSACEGSSYLHPSSEPERMSNHTVCYRAQTLRGSPDSAPYLAEVISRQLDCNKLLAGDPLMSEQRY